MLTIIKDEDFLRQKSKPITEYNQELFDFIKEMFITLKEVGGVGLAAPQVGRLERFLIVRTPYEGKPYAIFNPEIVATSIETKWDWEGCLSIPHKTGLVERPFEIGLQSLNIQKNKYFLSKANGLLARIVLHEINHLDGILFTDVAKEIKYTGLDSNNY